ncbi:OmpA family protein [Rhodospirillaceae bacterium KN72]|uniref:OmpA family protein n=1 Tax=Pacificispira spongiicola TaxID=2729598 RepID=A0A7Y0E4H5_9PROT|nr:OmpA family protein [Pacificispira spongiicola]NMM46276.1 OmpA family protein [Pacificispira spongiicola]
MQGDFPRSTVSLSIRAALAAAVLFGVTACDSSRDVVDAVNPVKWFEGDEAANSEPKPIPGEDGDYPAIGAVPDRPEEPAIKREYMQLADVLAADRENALYTDEVIRREAPPVRVITPPDPTQEPAEPPTASVITAPPESVPPESSPQPAPQPVPVPQATPQPAPQPAQVPQPAPAPSPSPSQAQTAQAAPQPAPAPQPLTQSQSSAPAPASAPPPAPNVAQAAPATGAAAATRTQMIATIYFPSGGARLTERDREILNQVAGIYSRDGGKRVVIVGHSSRSGASGDESQQALVNYKVSLDRAAAVGQVLVSAGIPIEQIVVDARGSKELKYSEETPAGEAGNRRAEVFLQY